MVEAGAEVLPERRVRPGVIGGKQQRKHEDQAGDARRPDQNSEGQCQTDREFTVGDQEGNRRGVWKDKTAQDRNHERIGGIVFQELVNPELEAAMKGEVSGEDFVLGEHEKQEAHRYAEKGKRALIGNDGGRGHGRDMLAAPTRK